MSHHQHDDDNERGQSSTSQGADNKQLPGREVRVAIADQIGRLEHDDLRNLAQTAQRQLMGGASGPAATTPLLFADGRRTLLSEAGDERRGEFEAARDLGRRQMAARLREFPRLRSDQAFKTAINAALENVVLATLLADRISHSDFNALSAPWRSVTGWPEEHTG